MELNYKMYRCVTLAFDQRNTRDGASSADIEPGSPNPRCTLNALLTNQRRFGLATALTLWVELVSVARVSSLMEMLEMFKWVHSHLCRFDISTGDLQRQAV